jgi:hypothetical protein
MQYIQRASLKVHQAGKYQQWLVENEPLIAQNAPAGWTYVGTWFTVRGFGRYDCEVRWELDDYAALGSDFGNEVFQKAMMEGFEFFDPAQGGETYLMKSAGDIHIMQGA